MDTLETILQARSDTQIPEPVSWALVVLLTGVVVWTLIRYISKLDKILERLEDSIDGINKSLIQHAGRLDNHEAGIKDLREITKVRPRRSQ